MAYQRWTHSNTSVFNIGYHLIWCPKYRRKVLVSAVEIRLKELLYEKATELDIQIIKLEIMPDNIHVFVKTKPTNAPHYIVQQFKGYTSNMLRKEFSHLLKMPSLWTRSYYCESVGHISEKTVLKYIEEQKNK
ncbi:MAG: IS200/IS605 family transposase [Synergistaceae bacterium]|nr:IS200/IS605 family transposase [Synergistaceae bacterium]